MIILTHTKKNKRIKTDIRFVRSFSVLEFKDNLTTVYYATSKQFGLKKKQTAKYL